MRYLVAAVLAALAICVHAQQPDKLTSAVQSEIKGAIPPVIRCFGLNIQEIGERGGIKLTQAMVDQVFKNCDQKVDDLTKTVVSDLKSYVSAHQGQSEKETNAWIDARMEKAKSTYSSSARELLTPVGKDTTERLFEIYYWSLGPSRVLTSVFDSALGLSKSQRGSIHQILEKFRKDVAANHDPGSVDPTDARALSDAYAKDNESARECDAEILNIMTAAQARTIKQMLGSRFEFQKPDF